MNTSQAATYGAALTRFLSRTGLAAAELAELAGVSPVVVLDAVAGHELPTPADRGLLADQINFIKRERGL